MDRVAWLLEGRNYQEKIGRNYSDHFKWSCGMTLRKVVEKYHDRFKTDRVAWLWEKR